MTDDQALIDEAVEMCDASEKSGRVTVAGLGIREVRSLVAALERALMDSKRLDWVVHHQAEMESLFPYNDEWHVEQAPFEDLVFNTSRDAIDAMMKDA